MLEQTLSSGAWEWGCLSKPSLPPSSHRPLHPLHPLATPHHDSLWHPRAASALKATGSPHLPPASSWAPSAPSSACRCRMLGWNRHLLPVGGWREQAGCGGGWTVAIGDSNRCFLVEAALANSGLCGLRQNPNYFQLGDCSDSCSEQGLLSRLRNLPPLLAGFGYLHFWHGALSIFL